MAEGAKQAWNEVGDRFSSWGKHLSDRYKESGTAEEEPGETQRKLEEAAKEIGDTLSRAFNAFGDTLRDDQAKAELLGAVHAMGDAITATVREAGDAIKRKGEPSGEPRPDTTPEPPATPTDEPEE
jgi:hypothetical protein